MELKKVCLENVNFMKKVKRVDVKRLKDDIWMGLKDFVFYFDKVGDIDIDDEDFIFFIFFEFFDFELVKIFFFII